MAILSIAIFDTPENGRSELTRRTLESLAQTVDFSRHRVFLVVNAATPETLAAIAVFGDKIGSALEVIHNAENVGTARAINKAWKHRKPGENAVKMDNDVVFGAMTNGWLDVMEEAVRRDPKMGIIGLKRKDLWENTWHPNPEYRSTIHMLPQKPGQMDIKVEKVNHVMGTCQMYSADLLEKIGYLYQPGPYGFDDSLSAIRCKVAGFYSCFLCNAEIDHIDPGGNDHTKWKSDITAHGTPANMEYHRLKAGYLNGTIGIYYDADGNNVIVPTTLDTVERAGPRYSWAVPNLHTR